MEITVKKAPIKDKPLIKKLMKPYLDELNTYFHGEINRDEYKYLNLYWEEVGRTPFLIYKDGEVCGLVLVNEYLKLLGNKGAKAIAEFYVMEKFRNRGIGKKAAVEIFNMFPGKWEVAVAQENIPGLGFWGKVIREYTQGKFIKDNVDNDSWYGPIYSFKSHKNLAC